MTDWVNSSCSATCGNSTLQLNRTISQINLNGGTPCSNETLIVYDCIDEPCPIGNLFVQLQIIVILNDFLLEILDCEVSNWTDISPCPSLPSCDTSLLAEITREVLVPAQFGGLICPDNMTQIYSCPISTYNSRQP